MSGLILQKMMDGCFLATGGDESLLLGCPSEILKVFLKKGIAFPRSVVLPDKFYYKGVIQADLEFPLFYFLFIYNGIAKGERFRVIGVKEQIERMKKLLSLILFGPTQAAMESWGIDKERISRQIKMADTLLGLPGKNGLLPKLDDLVEFIAFDESNKANLGRLKVEMNDRNIFTICYGTDCLSVDLNFYKPQDPPLPIELSLSNLNRPAFGATALSRCTSGFDYNGYTSGFILWIYSLAIEVDGMPWTKAHLRSLGLSSSEIQANILSHIHGDHSNILEMIINGQKVNLLTAEEIYRSFILKASLILGWSEERLIQMINFTPIKPEKPFDWFGAKFTFFDTIHPLSTVGFEVEVAEKKIIYVADTAWGKKLQELRDNNVINDDQLERIDELPASDADLIIMDGGGGHIHPDIQELDQLSDQKKARIFLTHRSQLPKGVSGLSLIESGQSWDIIPAPKLDMGDINAVVNLPLFDGLDRKWLSAVLARGKVMDIYSGSTILSEGGPNQNFYIILRGDFSITTNDGEELVRLGTSDFFGEMSLTYHIPCTATVTAITRGKLLAVPQEIFSAIISSTAVGKKLRKIHRVRPILIKCGLFRDLPRRIINQLAVMAVRKVFKAGQKILNQNQLGKDVFFIESGGVNIVVEENGLEGRHIATLYPGQFFGEMAQFSDGIRNASVFADKETAVFMLKGEKFNRLIEDVPFLVYSFGVMAQECGAELWEKIDFRSDDTNC